MTFYPNLIQYTPDLDEPVLLGNLAFPSSSARNSDVYRNTIPRAAATYDERLHPRAQSLRTSCSDGVTHKPLVHIVSIVH